MTSIDARNITGLDVTTAPRMPRVAVASTVVASPVEDAIVLLDVTSGTYFSVRGPGTVIWRHIERGAALEDAIEEIVATYDTEAAQACTDAIALIEDALARGLLTARADHEGT